LRVLCLVDGRVKPSDRWLWNHLPAEARLDTVDFLHASTRDLFPKWGKLMTYYPAYWNLALKALRRSREVGYDLIVAWESKNGFPLAILRSLLGIKKPPLVILAFAYKGIAANFVKLGRFGVNGIDHVTVPTVGEIEYYSRLLGLSLEKVTFCPLGWYDMVSVLDRADGKSTDYIFAGGRSGRDYETLFEAVSQLDVQLIVNARRFNLRGLSCPPNVEINSFMPLREYYGLMARAKFVVLTLQNTPYAVGLGHIVQAMSAGRALIATRTASTVDYIKNGQTGILVPPYDPEALKAAIDYLLTHPEEAKAMGGRARQKYEEGYTFEAFAKRTYDVLVEVAEPNRSRGDSILCRRDCKT